MTTEEAKKVFEYLEKKANTQEPCDTVSIRKDILKCRVGNIVAYNVEWLKDHWQMEMDIVCGVKPCDDAVSRDAVLKGIEELKKSPWCTDKRGNGFEYLITEALDVVADLCVKQLPSVTQKSGKWNKYYTSQKGNNVFNCKECGHTFVVTQGKDNMNYCPNCGAKMESGDKE